MNEMLNHGVESVLTTELAAGAMAGYIAGQIAESRVTNYVEKKRNELHDYVQSNERTSRIVRAIAPLAIMGAVAGIGITEAFVSHDVVLKSKPAVELVLNHSFQVGRDGKTDAMNKVTLPIMRNKDLKTRVLLAHNGDYDVAKTTKEVKQDVPYGPSSLDAAVVAAIDNAYNNSSERQGGLKGSKTHNAGVLILTNGNPIGKPQTIITQSQSRGNIPVFIGDFSEKNTSVTSDLQAVASKTNGQYWKISKNDKKIQEKIKSTLSPSEIKMKNDNERIPYVIIASLALGAMVSQYRRRKKNITGQAKQG